MAVAARGAGPAPPLGPVAGPATGFWTTALDARPPHDQTLHLAGLERPVTAAFEPDGTVHVRAGSEHDLWLATGYLHARFRLAQMDLARRQGAGRLAEVVGPDKVASDTFELQLGLERTARATWAELAPGDPSRLALQAYADGVNRRIAEAEAGHQLPLLFTLLGYRPRPWTPVDSLVVQGEENQLLSFTDTPLDAAMLVASLGAERVREWFPVLPPNQQHPYDRGPYRPGRPAPIAPAPTVTPAVAEAAGDARRRLTALPQLRRPDRGNSNNWAVDGSKTASGKPLLAGDPHLPLTLPAIWFQMDLDAPTYRVSGATIPGLPGVVIGHNDHIAWSLTNVENQQTFFYLEQTDAAHPGQYRWRGAWRPFKRLRYRIGVKGADPVRLEVLVSVHGPVLTRKGRTVAVDWLGARPSQDVRALAGVGRAAGFAEFRDALREWRSPSQNFVYADDRGDIGLVAAGDYPVLAGGTPWLPLPGTGEADIVGRIPFDAIPQAHNPASHLLFSANQRPVGPGYPWYLGTTLDFFDPGYRAGEIAGVLAHGQRLTAADMQRLQHDVRDQLAVRVVPKLLRALDRAALPPRQQRMRELLAAWDDQMTADSPAAAVWRTFWEAYVDLTFEPWLRARKVPAEVERDTLLPSLVPVLESWTLRDPGNRSFWLPDGTRRTAPQVMTLAFAAAEATLARQLGPDPASWRWGRLHAMRIDSLAGIDSLAYGPRPRGGDERTVDVAGGLLATDGPSWRFVMDWGSRQASAAYPGGQSENPASPWWADRVAGWWDGRYAPMLTLDAARRLPGSRTWTLAP